MKKIFVLLPFLAVACTSELVLPVDGADEILVVNGSLCSSDSLHTVSIVSSSASKGIVSPPSDVRLDLYVNGVLKSSATEPEVDREKTRKYLLKCRFASGDHIRLTVESSLGLCEVEGIVPAAPEIVEARDGGYMELTYNDYGSTYTRVFSRVMLTLNDPSGEKNAYRVHFVARARHELIEALPNGSGHAPGSIVTLDPKELPVFNMLEPSMRLPWKSLNSVNFFNVCSDNSFDGERYTLNLCIKKDSGSTRNLLAFSPPSAAASYQNGVEVSELWCTHQWLDVKLEAIPYDTWRYLMAVEYDSNGPVFPIVYEPTLFPSNVKGGLGYVNISSATVSTLELPDVWFDSSHWPDGYLK